jgi:hypothetical protein
MDRVLQWVLDVVMYLVECLLVACFTIIVVYLVVDYNCQ